MIAPVATASADPVSSARAQIAALQSQIASDSTHLHQLTVAYNADALQASELAQQAQAASAQIQSLSKQVQQNESIVRQVAVLSYTGEVQAPQTLNVSPLVSQAYIDATVGDISDTEDALHSEQEQTQVQLTQLRQATKAESAQVQAASVARSQALSQASIEQSNLAVDQQHLTTLLAEVPAPSRPASVQGLGTGLVATVRSQVAPLTAVVSSSPSLDSAPATTPTTSPTTAPPVSTTVESTPTTLRPPTTTPPSGTAPETGGGAGGPWLALRECESGDNYQENTGNGFYGAYQFSASTWADLGYPGLPYQEPPAMQDAAAMKLQAESGWGQWPACSATLGL